MLQKLKQAVKQAIGPRGLRAIRFAKSRAAYAKEQRYIARAEAANKKVGIRFIDIGGGLAVPPPGWRVADKHIGVIIDANTVLPFADRSLELVYSSMFFEHIDNATAANLMKEIARVLKADGTFRLIVPDFWLWLEKYRTGDIDYFLELQKDNPDLKTWSRLGVPIDIEHLLAWHIAAIHNKPHRLTNYPHLENPKADPPIFTFPHHFKLDGYYCGPAPELTTADIRANFVAMSSTDFLEWIFAITSASKHQDPTFNSWHKNWWNPEKIRRFAQQAGLGEVKVSAFGHSAVPIPDTIEKEGHNRYGLYFDIAAT